MKIVVISDTHSKTCGIKKITKQHKDIDLMIHLGDYYEDAYSILKNMSIPWIGIKGNCDIGDIEEEKILEYENHKLLLTHGHRYDVKTTLQKLYYKALEVSADIVLFGHTHIPIKVEHESVLMINPGSLGLPRGHYKPSYTVLELKKGEVFSHMIEF